MLPFFLGTRRAGIAHGLKLSLTNPLDINSSTCLLYLYGLLRIHPIGWFIRQDSSGIEAYMMLNRPLWGQSQGNATRKNMRKELE